MFRFREDELDYMVKDTNGRVFFSVPYREVPKDSSELEERNGWFRNVGMLWVLIGIVQITHRVYETGNLAGSIWLTLGLICFGVYWFAKTRFTVLPTEKGTIFVIQNKDHKRILNEMSRRRKKQFLYCFGEIDFENDPEDEARKFHWLRSEAVITEEELSSYLNKIRAYHQESETQVEGRSELVH